MTGGCRSFTWFCLMPEKRRVYLIIVPYWRKESPLLIHFACSEVGYIDFRQAVLTVRFFLPVRPVAVIRHFQAAAFTAAVWKTGCKEGKPERLLQSSGTSDIGNEIGDGCHLSGGLPAAPVTVTSGSVSSHSRSSNPTAPRSSRLSASSSQILISYLSRTFTRYRTAFSASSPSAREKRRNCNSVQTENRQKQKERGKMNMEKRYFTLTVQSGNPIPQVTGWYGQGLQRRIIIFRIPEANRFLFIPVYPWMSLLQLFCNFLHILLISFEEEERTPYRFRRFPVHIKFFSVQAGAAGNIWN